MKYGNEIKNICHLAWPAIIQEAMNTVVTYVDTGMVGSMGATASAAVGLTSTVTWLLGSISVAFGVGVLAVCAQSAFSDTFFPETDSGSHPSGRP